METLQKDIQEKLLTPRGGGKMLLLLIALALICVGLCVVGAVFEGALIALFVVGILGFTACMICLAGLKVVAPNEAMVLMFFGKYYGTIAKDGFFWVNPFCSVYNPASIPTQEASAEPVINTIGSLANAIQKSRRISLKAITLNNAKQKVNDEEGNPIEIGVVVVWRVINTAKAVFNVENYVSFISTQTDSAIRNIARSYPYDVSDAGDEKSLRGSSQEIANVLKEDLQKRVEYAGIEVMEARITHLAYAPEIAAAMLQRQQAKAIIVARQKIVEGAVGMVEMALEKLQQKNICELDAERKAQMVSNLLVVLCGNKDAQPIVNSGSIY